MIYLGITKLLTRESIVNEKEVTKIESVRKTYFSAVLTNTLNPKVAIFFLAFFPQFIQIDHLRNALPFIILGVTYALTGLLWFAILTLFAGSFSHKLKTIPSIGIWLNKFSGAAFILMGIKVALTKR